MQIPIERITIKKRARTILGDLEPLMASMREHGLLNPVIITERYELVAGRRRLEAAKRLGWKTIEAKIVRSQDEAALLAMEIDENILRLDFTTEELARARKRLEKLRNPSLLSRLIRKVRRFFQWLFQKS